MTEIEAPQLATIGGKACPVCAAPVELAADLGNYCLFSCEHCGCWCSDAASKQAQTSFTPENYFSNDLEPAKWQDLDRRLAAAGRSVDSVLDVGCGTGAYLTHVQEQRPGARRVGIELDEERAALARERNPGAEILTGDAEQSLAAATGTFDLITLWDVFEHVTSPATLLCSLADRLSPHGCMFIQTIHEHSIVPALGRWSHRLTGGRLTAAVRRTHDAHHLVFFTKEGLQVLAAAAEVRIAEQWFDHLARNRMDGHPVVTALTAALLNAERLLGNGLFVNVIFERSGAPDVSRRT